MRCTACLTVNPAGNRFCGSCGAALAGSPRVESDGPGRNRSGWGELKQATVLFADVVSSTEQIAALDPEQAMERLQPAMVQMCEAVERFGGTVVRTLGDGILALFGVPLALEGHARLACEAALYMQTSFAGHAQSLSIRVGLHSGLVASDPVGADGSRSMGAHGLTIHLASRVVDQAEPGSVCISADCHSLIRIHYETRSMGRHALKGVAEPVELYTLIEPKPDTSNPQFHQTELTTLHGREGELARLQQAFGGMQDSDVRVIGISGAPGTGKSRLCHEFALWCKRREVPVHQVRAQLYGHATPLQAVLGLLRVYVFHIAPGDDALVARSRVAQTLSELDASADGDLALLFEFLGLANPDTPLSQLNPKVRHARLMHVVRELFRHVASTPSVLIIEDLHWLDEASEEFVDNLVTAAEGTRALVLLNYRPAYLSPWTPLRHFEQMDLPELDVAHARALVRELLGLQAEDDGICELIARRSGGNPFFAEELVRSLEQSRALASPATPAERLAWAEYVLPSSVQAVIGARVDRLEENQKSLLQMCAIVGKEVPLGVLSRVARTPADEMNRLLDALYRAALIQPQIGREGRSLAFRHPLIQEVTYGMQLKARRATLHATVGQAMEAHYSDQLDEHAGLIGHHYEVAGEMLAAARHVGRAAQWVGANNSSEALKRWRKVWDLLKDWQRSEEADRLRSAAGGQIGQLGWREGLKFEEVKPVLDEAIALADGKDKRLVQSLMIIDGRMQVSSGGSADEFVKRATRALQMTPAEDVGRIAMLNAMLSQALGWAGRIQEALIANTAAMEFADAVSGSESIFVGFNVPNWLVVMRGRLLIKLGRMQEAVECMRERLMSVPAESADITIEFIGHGACIEWALSQENLEAAEHHLAVVSRMAGQSTSPYLRVFGLAYSGAVLMMKGELAAARSQLEESLDLVRRVNVAMEFEPEILGFLAECLLRADEPGPAARLARECIALAQVRGTRLAECRACMTLALAMLDEGVTAEAVRDATALLARAEALVAETGAVVYRPLLEQVRSRVPESVSRSGEVNTSPAA